MKIEDWHNFFNGNGPDEVVAGRFDATMCSVMGVSDDRVLLDRYYVSKFVEKHNLRPEDMLSLTGAISLGRVVRESEGRISVFYMEVDRDRKLFKAAIKVIPSNRKLYVSTFHRSDLAQLRRVSLNGYVWRKEKKLRVGKAHP